MVASTPTTTATGTTTAAQTFTNILQSVVLPNGTYDAENRLIKVDGGATATYVYDANGTRVQKTTAVGSYSEPVGTWIFLNDQSGRIIGQINVPGNTFVRGEVFAGGRHLASYIGGNTYFMHSDWLGTERFRTAYNSGLTESCASLPFGDWLTCAGTDFSPLHLTGKERDAESGLDNFGARYNASPFGRFMSPDPDNAGASDEDPQSWNAYIYVSDDPLNGTDPDGRADCPDKDPYKCTVKADPPPKEPVITYRGVVVWENAGRAAQKANDYLRTAWDWWRTSKVDPGCLAATTAFGASAGASAGTSAAPALQLALAGPTGGASVALGPGGPVLGGLAGAGLGGAGGWLVGQVACRTGGGGSGSGGSGGSSGGGPKLSPKFRPPTNPPQPPPSNAPAGWRVRVEGPAPGYPKGYWRLEKPMANGGWQGINPSTMKPGPQWDTHVPLP